MVDVECEGQTERLPLQIIKESGPSLFGSNWLSKIRFNWPTIKKISNELDRVLDKHPELFKDELGTLKDAKAQLFVKPGAVHKFHRPGPHAIKGAIVQELDRLENMGVLEKVRLTLLGPKSDIPTLAAARLQRWAILLSAYQYEIKYRSTLKHANADCLSRLPYLDKSKSEESDEVKLISSLQIGSLPLTADHIRKAIRADLVLS